MRPPRTQSGAPAVFCDRRGYQSGACVQNPGWSWRETKSVKIEIGPVARASALAWLDYGTDAIADLRRVAPKTLSPSAIDGFESLIAAWRVAAERPGPFHWETDEAPERVEFLMKALYQAGLEIEDGTAHRDMKLRPAAADEFHIVLVRQVLSTLAQEGRSNAEFVESLRNDWLIARED